MTTYSELEPGDRIRLLAVPQLDLEQRERELREGRESAGWTADTIEQILREDPVVTIDRVDENGYPWFEYELETENGKQWHSIMIMESESWERLPSDGRR